MKFLKEKADQEAERLAIKQKAEEEKLRLQQIEEQKKQKEAKAKLMRDYFKLINMKGLSKYIGQPKKLKAMTAAC